MALGIDPGTAFTVGAVAEGSGLTLVELETGADPPWLMPSAVAAASDGRILVGRPALDLGRGSPDRLERAPLLALGGPALLLGATPIEPEAAVGALLGAVVSRAARHARSPGRVAIVHPATWRARRRSALERAARAAGIGDLVLVPSPIAAAAALGTELDPGAPAVVIDLGARSVTMAVVRRTADAFELVGEPFETDRLSGEGFDRNLYEHAHAALARDAPDVADRLANATDPSWRAADAALRRGVRVAKMMLTRSTVATIDVPPPVGRQLRVTRAELEEAVADDVAAMVELMLGLASRAGVTPDGLRAVYLVGGASRLPAVAQEVAARCAAPVRTVDEPKSVGALGAARIAAARAEKAGAEAAPTGATASKEEQVLAGAGTLTPVAVSPLRRRGITLSIPILAALVGTVVVVAFAVLLSAAAPAPSAPPGMTSAPAVGPTPRLSAAPSPSPAPSLSPAVTEPPAYARFDRVVDVSGALSMEVPTEWSDVFRGGLWIVADRLVGAYLAAAPSIQGYNTDWRTPGVEIGASDVLAAEHPRPGDPGRAEALIDVVWGSRTGPFFRQCETLGVDALSDPSDAVAKAAIDRGLSGWVRRMGNCGAVGTGELHLVLWTSDGDRLYALRVRVPDPRDLEAAVRAVATIQASGELPAASPTPSPTTEGDTVGDPSGDADAVRLDAAARPDVGDG